MNTHADKTQQNRSQSAANGPAQKQGNGASVFQLEDNRPEAIQLRKLQEIAQHSPQAQRLKARQELADNSPHTKNAAQLQAIANNHAARTPQSIQKKENKTGLPDDLKSGIENLSGYSMDDVKVHYNSGKPSQLSAHAYAQGTDIHVAPGQERHLSHEAWHIVQQKQGRVKPTTQMKGVGVNDDHLLEREADRMGQLSTRTGDQSAKLPGDRSLDSSGISGSKVLQGVIFIQDEEWTESEINQDLSLIHQTASKYADQTGETATRALVLLSQVPAEKSFATKIEAIGYVAGARKTYGEALEDEADFSQDDIQSYIGFSEEQKVLLYKILDEKGQLYNIGELRPDNRPGNADCIQDVGVNGFLALIMSGDSDELDAFIQGFNHFGAIDGVNWQELGRWIAAINGGSFSLGQLNQLIANNMPAADIAHYTWPVLVVMSGFAPATIASINDNRQELSRWLNTAAEVTDLGVLLTGGWGAGRIRRFVDLGFTSADTITVQATGLGEDPFWQAQALWEASGFRRATYIAALNGLAPPNVITQANVILNGHSININNKNTQFQDWINHVVYGVGQGHVTLTLGSKNNLPQHSNVIDTIEYTVTVVDTVAAVTDTFVAHYHPDLYNQKNGGAWQSDRHIKPARGNAMTPKVMWASIPATIRSILPSHPAW